MQAHYDSKTIYYHWISAFLIVVLWCLGQTIDWFPKGHLRITARSIHITLGLVFAIILALRLAWKYSGATKLPPSVLGTTGKIAIGVHHLLYQLMVILVILGIAAVWIRGDSIFNLFQVPTFDPSNHALREDVVDLHGLFANILAILAGAHAAMAIWHHKVIKDNVLRRMLPMCHRK